MTRRDFLKLAANLGIVVTIPAELMEGQVPLLNETTLIEKTAPTIGVFDPDREYGWAINYHGANYQNTEFLEATESFLVSDARKILPAGIRFEIRQKAATDYGYYRGMAWYYAPNMTSKMHDSAIRQYIA